MKKVLALVLSVLVAAVCLPGCSSRTFYSMRRVFGPLICTMELRGAGAESAGEEAFEFLLGLEREISTSVVYDAEAETAIKSPVYLFNEKQNKGAEDKFEIDYHLYTMGVECVALYEETGGIFNPAVYPVVKAWGLDSENLNTDPAHRAPAAEELAAILGYCDYDDISFSREGEGADAKYYMATASGADGRMQVDFGGYAKGYAADRVRDICKKHGIKSANVNISGNALVYGKRPGGGKWRIAVSDPFSALDFCVAEFDACSAVTSGVYERYYKMSPDGKQTGYTAKDTLYVPHIIGRDGMPVNLSVADGVYSNDGGGIAGATVITQSSALADAYATTVCVLGAEAGLKFLEDKGLAGVIITMDRKYAVSGEIKLYSPKNKDYTLNKSEFAYSLYSGTGFSDK